jgi:pilus assembly protein FimV
MVRKLAFSICLTLLIVPFSAQGLGLGEITLNSALNQPLDADIELLSVEPEDLVTLVATMASADLFDRYGLDRAAFLGSIRLEIRRQSGDRHVIHISSNSSITEPFVTMLIELDWARGHMLREYTVLLDPPIFAAQPDQPAPTPVAPTPRTSTSTTGTVVRMPEPEPIVEPDSKPVYRQPSATRAMPAAERPDEYRVQRNDTLWELARDMRPAGIEINQMMIAMFRANPEAFYGNINRLKAGVILRIPDSVEMADINRTAATDEVKRQMVEWRPDVYASYVSGAEENGRLRLVPADSSSQGGGGVTGADEELAQELADQTTENLLLRDQIEDLSTRVDEQDRLLEVQDSELALLQSQLSVDDAADDGVTITEPDISDGTTADDTGADLADATAADTTTDAGADTAADATTEPGADTTTTTRPVPSVVTRPRRDPSLMERAMDLAGNQWVWIGLGVLVLGIGGMSFARRRREDSGYAEILGDEPYGADEMESSGTARIKAIPRAEDGIVVEESVVPDVDPFADTIAHEDDAEESGETIDEAADALDLGGPGVDLESTMPGVEVDVADLDQTVSGETAVNLEGADPLAEADFHMAYGLYDQAADLVQKALEKEPGRTEFRTKLAEIFFVWGNKDSFMETVQYLHEHQDEMADGEWDKIAIMGRQIDESSSLFSGESGAASVAIVDMQLEETKVTEVDVDLLTGTGAHEVMSGETEETAFDDVFSDAGMDADDGNMLNMDEERDDELDVSGLAAAELGDDEEQGLDEAIGAAAAVASEDLDATGQTAELNIDDLGLGDELDATGTMQVVDMDDEDEGVGIETMEIKAEAKQKSEEEGLDFDFSGEAEEPAADPGATAQMPTLSMDDEDDEEQMFTDVFGEADESRISDNLDLDIGADIDSGTTDDTIAQTTEMTREMDAADDGDGLDHTGTMKLPDPSPVDATGMHEVTGIHEAIVDEDYTGTMKLPDSEADAETLSEVGTKLDLARAYVDMGDPDGARSILEEVLEEGNDQQKAEAQTLIDNLP